MKIMKKTLAFAICLAAACAMCGCGEKDGDKKTTSANNNSDSQIKINADSDSPAVFAIEISQITFEGLSDFSVNYSDHSSNFMTAVSCTVPEGLEDGTYTSPDVQAFVNETPCEEELAYIFVTGDSAVINLSFYAGYVPECDEITVTIKDFNKFLEAENEGDMITYYDISDETVLEGSLKLKTTAEESFGYYKFDISHLGGEYVVLNDVACSVEGADGVFTQTPSAEDVVIVMKDKTEITFDNCVQAYVYDEDGNPTEEYSLELCMNDSDVKIDLENVADVIICEQSVLN